MTKADFVIVHGRSSGTGRPRSWVAADVVRIADGVLAKNWDVLLEQTGRAESKSGLLMCGGSFAYIKRWFLDAQIPFPDQKDTDHD